MEDQRAAFEAWAKNRDMHLHRIGPNYHSTFTHLAWQAWRAAIEQARLNPQADTQLATTHVPAP